MNRRTGLVPGRGKNLDDLAQAKWPKGVKPCIVPRPQEDMHPTFPFVVSLEAKTRPMPYSSRQALTWRLQVADAMVTIGRGQLDAAVHDFFEGLRSYDPVRAAKVLAPDADFESPWSQRLVGKPAIEQFLATWLKDPQARPSFTIRDVSGDGAVTRLKLSVSGRFGKAPEHVVLHALCLKHVVHHVKIVPDGAANAH